MWCDAPVEWDTSIVKLMDLAYKEGLEKRDEENNKEE